MPRQPQSVRYNVRLYLGLPVPVCDFFPGLPARPNGPGMGRLGAMRFFINSQRRTAVRLYNNILLIIPLQAMRRKEN